MRDWIYMLGNCRALGTVPRRGATGQVCDSGTADEVTDRHITTSPLELLVLAGSAGGFRPREVKRVSRGAFMTTPNRLFPVDLHTRTPLLHYLLKSVFDQYTLR